MQVMQYFLTGLLLVIVFLDNAKGLPAEPVCSKFDYEMKTLEAMLRIENRAEKMMEELKSVRDSMTKELQEFKNFKAEFERKQTAMESKFTVLKSEVEEVPEKMTEEMQSLRDSMTKGLDETERQRTATESKIIALKSKVDEKLVPAEVIAFSVANPTKQIVNGVPTFKTVITNIGNGYDVDTGIFTCPVGGLYMLVFTVASQGQYDVYCWIKHNGTNKVLGRSFSDNSYTTASASINLLLLKGDLVTLGSCGAWNKVHNYNGYITFSGALIEKNRPGNMI